MMPVNPYLAPLDRIAYHPPVLRLPRLLALASSVASLAFVAFDAKNRLLWIECTPGEKDFRDGTICNKDGVWEWNKVSCDYSVCLTPPSRDHLSGIPGLAAICSLMEAPFCEGGAYKEVHQYNCDKNVYRQQRPGDLVQPRVLMAFDACKGNTGNIVKANYYAFKREEEGVKELTLKEIKICTRLYACAYNTTIDGCKDGVYRYSDSQECKDNPSDEDCIDDLPGKEGRCFIKFIGEDDKEKYIKDWVSKDPINNVL